MSSPGETRPRPVRAKSTDIARWGAACAPCAAAKAKCSRSSTTPSAKCDRCERLLKHCTDQVHQPRRKRQSKPRTVNSDRHFSGLLKALGETTDRSSSPSDFASDLSCASSAMDPIYPQDRATQYRRASETSQAPSETRSVHIPETYLSYAPPTCICQPQVSIVPASMDSDDTLLNIFRQELTLLYPFVVVPGYVTAHHLRQTRPFTMSAIRVVAGIKDLNSMRLQLYQTMSHIADHMLLRAERSLDLLMGIVVLLGWYHHHCVRHNQLNNLICQLNNLICLAQSLVGDLGLNRNPYVAGYSVPERTNEERRLLLAVWYLTSSTGIHSLQIDTMRYTPYMEHCARDLLRANEYPSDEVLVHCTLLQRLTEKIWRLTSPDYGIVNGVTGEQGDQGQRHTDSLETQLEKVVKDVPLYLRSNSVIISHINAATLRLHEAPLIDAANLAHMTGGLTVVNSDGSTVMKDRFRRSTQILKDWWDRWLAMPTSQCTRYPTPMFFHLIHGVSILHHWVSAAMAHDLDDLEDAGPSMRSPPSASIDPGLAGSFVDNADTIRERIDALGLGSSMIDFLHKFSNKCREVSQSLAGAAGVETGAWDNNVWQLADRKARSCRTLLMKLAESVEHASSSAPNSVDDSDELPGQGYASEPYGSGVDSTSYAGSVHSSSGSAYPLQPAAVHENWSWSSSWPVPLESPDSSTWYNVGEGPLGMDWHTSSEHPETYRSMGP
ncbi:hypothetical protein GE09DRAFT_1094551 [Coniochaeta sp. 2T2.1]|nr:hypothetical protein GE09DRAFT_1094551 [Coniochaeta sp. 2T2.1]